MAGDMTFMEVECDENGLITWDSLKDLSIDDVQDLIEVLEDAVRVDNKNLEVLKSKRTVLGLELFDTTYQGKTNFMTETHIYSKQPKSTTSGLLIQKNYPMMWKELCTKFAQLLNPSKKAMESYLKAKGVDNAQIEETLKHISVDMQPAVTAKKR